MKYCQRTHWYLNAIALIALIGTTKAQSPNMVLTDNKTENPQETIFVYKDVENFINSMKAIADGMDSTQALQTLYFDPGTPGLRMFMEKYNLNTKRIIKALKKHSEEYAQIPKNLDILKLQENEFKRTYAEIKLIIPNAVFPPTYFLVAGYRGIGSGSVEGPLISIEKKTAQSIHEDLPATLVHEMIHMEQLAAVGESYFAIFSGEEKTLLATSIREGGATFMAQLITGGSKHKNLAWDYYLDHEVKLWQKFSSEMYGNEMGNWLWSRPANSDWPRDLGYAIGARIVEHYYNNANDKQKAAQEIMAIKDYPAFLKLSDYSRKFEE